MDTLWSMSTTVREAERIIGFLKNSHRVGWRKFGTSLIKSAFKFY